VFGVMAKWGHNHHNHLKENKVDYTNPHGFSMGTPIGISTEIPCKSSDLSCV
jgi:hypothetical protein